MSKSIIIVVLSFVCISLVGFSFMTNSELYKTRNQLESMTTEAEGAEKRAIQLAAEAVRCQKITELLSKNASELETELQKCQGK